MEPVLKAGIVGVIIAFAITFSLGDLYFLPSLVASLIVIYFFELKATKDAMLAALIVYVFTDWILNGLTAPLSINERFTITVDVGMVLNIVLTPLTALVAGFVGAELAATRRHTAAALQPPPPPPPQPQPLASPQVAPSTQVAETKFCRYCGYGNKTDAAFCEKCGKKIG
jgi:hypothetical protein